MVFCALRGTAGITWCTTSPPDARVFATGSAGLGAVVVGAGAGSDTAWLVASVVCAGDLLDLEYNNASTTASTTIITAVTANTGRRVVEPAGIGTGGSAGAGTERAAGCIRD